jgi:hypothetical protein
MPGVIPTTLAQALAQPNVAPVLLYQVTCGRWQPFWNTYSGSTYSQAEPDTVTDFRVNGVSLGAMAASIATVQATPGSWYWDGASVYVQLADSSNPNNHTYTLQYILTFRFAEKNCDVNNLYWEGRVLQLPSLSTRIETDFNTRTQSGGGQMTLNNADNFFSLRKDDRYYQWTAGMVSIYMGAVQLPWAQFVQLANMRISMLSFDDPKVALLDIVEVKQAIDTQFPLVPYDYTTYPNLRKDDVGRYIQTIYGQVYGVEAVCIDVTNRIFQLAGHAITALQATRVNQPSAGNVWNTVTPASVNLTTAQFTLNSGDWAYGQYVVCDVQGKPKADGTLMENPSDQIKDLLAQVNTTNINAASFTAAYNFYDVGYTNPPNGTRPNPTYRVTRCAVGLYLDGQDSILNIINKITSHARCYFFADIGGNFRLVPFKVQESRNMNTLTDPDVVDFQEQGVDATTDFLSSFSVTYGNRPKENYCQQVTYKRPKNQYLRNQPMPVADSFDSLFYKAADALEYAAWNVNYYDLAPRSFTVTTKWACFTWQPGDQFYLNYTEENLAVVLEIQEVELDLLEHQVILTCGTVRGFQNCPGFWISPSDTCPDGSGMTWNGANRAFKTLNTGTYMSPTDFAMAVPTDQTDHHVSVYS